jgi:hypothetical protein
MDADGASAQMRTEGAHSIVASDCSVSVKAGRSKDVAQAESIAAEQPATTATLIFDRADFQKDISRAFEIDDQALT